jgi:energy-coupling factor transport system permease protein
LALLVSTLRTSGRMSVAMDARGFAGAHRRTWAEPAPWGFGDTVLLLVGGALAVLPWVVRALYGG